MSWKARQNGFESRFIELAGHINSHMPRYVLERTVEALNSMSKPLRGSRVHLFGMAYKPNVGDVRESPAIDIAQLLQQRGSLITYTDPYVPSMVHGGIDLESVTVDEALDAGLDCALITTNHECFDYDTIVRRTPLIVDTRNALKGFEGDHIYRL